jgi:ABC-2 type transport system ATP-binding protein
VRTQSSNPFAAGVTFPAVCRYAVKDDYNIYFSSDIGPTISAIIAHITSQQDALIDLRVERPSLEDRFLEITNSGVAQ